MHTQAYLQGKEASETKMFKRNQNPYVVFTPQYYEWRKGWDDGKPK